MDKAAQFALAGKGVHYERRRPEDTVLYQLVQEHLESFLAQVELETGVGLPDFVKEEFDASLECGIPSFRWGRLWPTVFCACAAATAAMRRSSPFRVKSVAFDLESLIESPCSRRSIHYRGQRLTLLRGIL